MKPSKLKFDGFSLDRLKSELLGKINYSILTKPDCTKLSNIIVESGKGYISESTLYRLFFQFEKHHPNKSTLDIICRFLEYKDGNEFIEKLAESRLELHYNGINTLPNKNNGLLFYSIEHTAKGPLTEFFEETNEQPHQFKTDISISIFNALLKTTKQDWFFNEFAGQPYVREYFFERGHDTKFRIKNYDKAYLKYLESVHSDKDLQNFQDYIFGNCVLFRHYYVSKKAKEALNQAAMLYQKELPLDTHEHDIHIWPYIRYAAYKLWYLEITKAKPNELELYANYLLDLCKRLKAKVVPHDQKILFHTVAETFIHSSVSVQFHWDLKKVFINEFKFLPEIIYSKHLKYSLPYFDQNGAITNIP